MYPSSRILCTSPDRIRVGNDTRCYGLYLRLETNLFYTCRMLNKESTAAFYKRNTFYLTSSHFHGNRQACAITAFQGFLNMLGSQAPLLRVVCLDLNGLYDVLCDFSWTWSGERVEDVHSKIELLDFSRLLRVLWDRGLNIKISFAHYSTNWRWMAQNLVKQCDILALNRVFGIIQNVQLNLSR